MHRTKRRTKKGASAKLVELAIAAPQVVAIRTARMLAAGAHPGPADRVEFSRMHTEKAQAFWESMLAMSTQMVRTHIDYGSRAVTQWWRTWASVPWIAARTLVPGTTALPRRTGRVTLAKQQRVVSKIVEAGVGPVHKRATANARRLQRTKRR